MPQRLEAGEMRQAQKLVETLRQAKVGEPFAQAEPAPARARRPTPAPPGRSPS
jgi:hypothetical protein